MPTHPRSAASVNLYAQWVAGYSGTPLVGKLGIKVGHRIWLQNSPADLDMASLIQPLPDRARITRRKSASLVSKYDMVLVFVESQSQLERHLTKALDAIDKSGTVWVVWPKKSSERYKKGPKNVTEDSIRSHALQCGVVDVKVCAVDETWSGLKLVYRLSDR